MFWNLFWKTTDVWGRNISPSPKPLKLGSRSADQCYLPGPTLRSRGITSRRPPTRLSSALGRYVSPSPKSLKLGSRSADQCCLPGPELGSRGVTYRRPPSPESHVHMSAISVNSIVSNWDGFLPQSQKIKSSILKHSLRLGSIPTYIKIVKPLSESFW